MTVDELILGAIRDGKLKVCLQTGRVWYRDRISYCNPKVAPSWREKRAFYCPRKDRWRFHLQFGKRKTVVNKARLLLIVREGRRVEVADHRDEDRTNDAPGNVREHTRRESDRQGRRLQRERLARNAADYFDYIAFWGCEPPAGSQIDTGKGYR